MSAASTSGWSTAGTGSCQISSSAGHLRAEVAGARPHVAVGELEPGAGEGVGEGVRVLEEAPRDLLVGRVRPQRDVGGQHRRRAALASCRGRRGSCRRRRRSSASTGGRRPGSWSAPTRSRRGSRRSCCSTASASRSRSPRGRGDGVAAVAGAVGSRSSRGPARRGPRPRARGRRGRRSPAPWVLPKVWPPAISATVSSSSIAMRAKVSRMSRAEASGSGLPFGPSGLT